jgi:hypothetical protein
LTAGHSLRLPFRMPAVLRSLVLGLLLPGLARAAVPPCSGTGIDAVRCEIQAARAAAACLAVRPRGVVRRGLRRVGQNAERVVSALDRGAVATAGIQLRRAEGRLSAIRARLAQLGAGGRTAPDCVGPLLALVDGLDGDLSSFGGTTTTTLSTGRTTTTRPGGLPTTTTSTTTTSTIAPLCGNGRLDPGEQCDGNNLFGRDCLTLGFTGGELRCAPSCLFDTSRCTF